LPYKDRDDIDSLISQYLWSSFRQF
jgi:hypothetical protein